MATGRTSAPAPLPEPGGLARPAGCPASTSVDDGVPPLCDGSRATIGNLPRGGVNEQFEAVGASCSVRKSLGAALVAVVAGCAQPSAAVDLQAFLERRATCDHFRGEVPDPPDPQRMQEVQEQLVRSCTGSDAQLAALKKRYRDDPVVAGRLARFEERIEP